MRFCAGQELLWLLAIVVISTGCGQTAVRSDSESSVTIQFPDIDEYSWATWSYHSQLLVFLPVGDQGWAQGSLAESWEHSEDYRSWTVHLKDDVHWHDGTPVTSHDVRATLEANPFLRLEGASRDLEVEKDLYSFEVLDDRSYRITYNKNVGGLPGSPLDGWSPVLPGHLLTGLNPDDYRSWEFWTHPVGNGPYRYVRHVPKTMMEFEANPDFYLGKPRIEKVVLKFGSPSVVQLLSGEVDIIEYIRRDDYAQISDDERFRAYHRTVPRRIYVIGWNAGNTLFDSALVRRALTMAIDRRELQQVINLPETTPIFDGILTVRQYQREEIAEPIGFDLEEASRLLKESGWEDRDGDGVLDREGAPFRFQLNASSGSGMDRASVYVQSRLRRLGVEIEILTGEMARERVRNGDFEAAVFSITPFGGPLNLADSLKALGYQNTRLVQLLTEAGQTLNPDRRDKIYREVADTLQRDLPFTTLYPAVLTTVAHRRLKGLRTPDRASAAAFMGSLWIEEE
jgi:peptide/nickel transport system substrate-binding protein